MLLMCWLTASEGFAQTTTLDLTRPDDVRDAAAMSEAIDRMSARVSRCVQDKAALPSLCYCRFPTELADVRRRYEDTLQHHPDWADKLVSVRLSNGHTQIVSYPGLR